MLIDVDPAAAVFLRSAGYRVTERTFGAPYRVKPGDGYVQPWRSENVSGLTEQEIVVMQFSPAGAADEPIGSPPMTTAMPTVWVSRQLGVIDIRPLAAHYAHEDVERILAHGGVAVCFAAPRFEAGLVIAQQPPGLSLEVQHQLKLSLWSAIPSLDGFKFELLHGDEITPIVHETVLAPLAPQLEAATYNCKITPDDPGTWVTLATNKFGDAVCGLQFVKGVAKDDGLVLVLPQVVDQSATLKVLIEEVLPDLRPRLFPETQRLSWRHTAPYEVPKARGLRRRLERHREEAATAEAELKAELDATRIDHDWMLDLVSGTGDVLAHAVMRAFDHLGFENVTASDATAENGLPPDRLREDIQIAGEPLLLVEVKGLSHLPREEDSLAVTKYLAPRMRQLNRTDVHGLGVINHERHLPPLQRNPNPFQNDVLTNAQHHRFGLITGVDLFRLVINRQEHGWPFSAIKPLFYECGQIQPIPAHYELVGAIENFFEHASSVGIRVCGAGFAVGDTLAYELPIEFLEEAVTSLQINEATSVSATDGDPAGVRTTSLTKSDARTGVRVFRVGDLAD